MKDRLNQHTPRKDSWEKILGKMSFENQLETHISNLPQFEPDAESWEKISAKFRDKKPPVLWPYFGLVAGMVGVLLIYNLAWNNEENIKNPISDQYSLTEINVMDFPVNVNIRMESTPGNSKKISPNSKAKKISKPKEEEWTQISVEVPEFEFIAIDTPIILPIEKDSLADVESQNPSKTLHEVTISWGMKSTKLQIKTTFGKSDPVKLEEKKFGRSGGSGQIRFRQNN